jgi:hypothetical protein
MGLKNTLQYICLNLLSEISIFKLYVCMIDWCRPGMVHFGDTFYKQTMYIELGKNSFLVVWPIDVLCERDTLHGLTKGFFRRKQFHTSLELVGRIRAVIGWD